MCVRVAFFLSVHRLLSTLDNFLFFLSSALLFGLTDFNWISMCVRVRVCSAVALVPLGVASVPAPPTVTLDNDMFAVANRLGFEVWRFDTTGSKWRTTNKSNKL